MEKLEIFASIHPVLIYLGIFLALAVEGEIALFSAGLLVYFGELNYFLVLLAAFFGSWLGDMGWFFIGRRWGSQYLARRRGWFCVSQRYAQHLINHFQAGQSVRTLFLAKFSYGLTHLAIIMAGASLMNFKRFIRINGWTTAIWVLFILGLVQFLGHSFEYVKHLTKDIGLAAAGLIILLVAIEIILSRKATKSL